MRLSHLNKDYLLTYLLNNSNSATFKTTPITIYRLYIVYVVIVISKAVATGTIVRGVYLPSSYLGFLAHVRRDYDYCNLYASEHNKVKFDVHPPIMSAR